MKTVSQKEQQTRANQSKLNIIRILSVVSLAPLFSLAAAHNTTILSQAGSFICTYNCPSVDLKDNTLTPHTGSGNILTCLYGPTGQEVSCAYSVNDGTLTGGQSNDSCPISAVKTCSNLKPRAPSISIMRRHHSMNRLSRRERFLNMHHKRQGAGSDSDVDDEEEDCEEPDPGERVVST